VISWSQVSLSNATCETYKAAYVIAPCCVGKIALAAAENKKQNARKEKKEKAPAAEEEADIVGRVVFSFE
jgi:hypothetical protein